MTDHRPEVRELEKHSLPMTAGGKTEWRDYYLAPEVDALLAKLQSAPPIEPVGIREALEKLCEFVKVNGVVHHDYWHGANKLIKKANAALAACPVPVVDEVMTVFDFVQCRYFLDKRSGLTEKDRVRVVVWRVEK